MAKKAVSEYKRKQIGKNVTYYRERANLTKSELAHTLGVSPSTITRIEDGEFYPSYQLAKDMCQLFGITMEKLDQIIEKEN